MKNIIKLFGIVVLATIIGFAVIACDDGNSSDNLDLSGTITISPDTGVSTGTKLTATYSGNETVSYQWKKDGANVGTNSNEYKPDEAGSYTVTVSAAGYKSKTSVAVIVETPSTDGLSFTLIDSGTAYSVSRDTASDSVIVIVIPAVYNGLPVTAIAHNGFEYYGIMTSITIPDSVTSIGSSAFYNCSSLTSVTIPDSVTSIGSNAFLGCSSLTEINFNATALTDLTFQDNVFYYAGKSTTGITVNIGANVTKIPAYLFYYLINDALLPSKITTVNFASGSICQNIGDYAFFGCNYLTSITIPDSATSIGSCAFYKCSSLTSVTIPDSVTSIGSVFGYCSSLTSVTIPDSVTSIGSVFGYCSSLTSVTIPDSVTSIGISAFYYCSNLTSVTIPDSVTSIGQNAFYYCNNLTSITIPDSITSIGQNAFYYCNSLTRVTFEGTIASGGFIDNAFPGSDLRTKFYASDTANGTPGTYTRSSSGTTWTKE
jgi:hypothetical protein